MQGLIHTTRFDTRETMAWGDTFAHIGTRGLRAAAPMGHSGHHRSGRGAGRHGGEKTISVIPHSSPCVSLLRRRGPKRANVIPAKTGTL